MTDTVPATVPATAVHEERAIAAHTPRRGDFAAMSIPQAMEFANAVQRAEGMIPKAYLGNPGKILACVLAGQELGVGPMASLRAFHVVEGKPCADYTFWIARLRAAGYRVEWLSREQERVVLQLTAPNGSKHVETWDKARAVTAGLWNGKDPWKKYPQTMLSARCVTSAGRAFAGEVMFGCYEADEADEIIRDAQATVRVESITGTVTERAAAATGTAISEEAAKVDIKARHCADMMKALGFQRADMFALLAELKIEHTEKTRLTELPLEALERVSERLDEEAAMRADGGPKNGPTNE